MPHLEVLDGRFQGRKIPLKGAAFLIGREKGKNHLVLPDDKVSRRHVRLRIEDSVVTLEDLGTSNGTLLNGKRIRDAATLASGDEFQIGETRLRFGTGSPPPVGSPEPEPEREPEPAPEPPERPTLVQRRSREAPPVRAREEPREARLEKYIRTIESEDKDRARRATFWREDLAQRAGLYQLAIAFGLLAGAVALFAVAYLVAMTFVGEG